MKTIYVAALFSSIAFTAACGASYARSAPTNAASPPSNPNADEVLAAEAPAPAEYEKVANVDGSAGAGTSTATPSANTAGQTPTTTTSANENGPPVPHEMFDIEASMSIEVESLVEARAKVRDLVEQLKGEVVADQLTADAGYSHAHFDLRIPAGGANGFLDAVGKIGRVKSESLQAKDVGKDYYDAQLRLDSLEKALARYEELLALAKTVQEVMPIQQQINAIRTEIEQVKGNLRWLRDRVARATFHIDLEPEHPGESTWSPEAKLHPGIRFTSLTAFRGHGEREGFLGGGLSLFFLRSFVVDIDLARHAPHQGGFFDDVDAFLVTAGGDIYSDFFGAGRRTFLNPYLGLRVGYARIDHHGNMTIAGNLGLELYKSKGFLVDLGLRVHALFGNKTDGLFVGVQPAISFNVTF